MAPTLFEIKEVDRRFYERRIRDFLPERIADVHVHVWLARFRKDPGEAFRSGTWPSRVAKDCSIEDLVETYRLMLPGKTVIPLMFSNVMSYDDDFEASNAYVAEASRRYEYPALIWSSPKWSPEELETRIDASGFLGAKSYLSLAEPSIPTERIEIFDFFPREQLEVLNRRGWICMLHLPRLMRLRDPVNLRQIVEIEQRYPGIKLIVAHVGRAYCPEDVGDAFDVLGQTKLILFDISANTNAGNFEKLLRAVGPKRVLFGSDLPITRMRMRRACENGVYVNIVPKGLYADVSGDRHMREVSGSEAEQLTFFLYEEIDAFRRAAEAVELSQRDVEDVFYRNAIRVIEEARDE